jgi:transcriptional regulator with XRE-family HTH domain
MTAAKNDQGLKRTKEEIVSKLAERIKALRKEKGFSNYEKFANEFNLSRSQVGKYERGQNMTIYSIVSLLDTLDVPVSEFFSEGFDKKRKSKR